MPGAVALTLVWLGAGGPLPRPALDAWAELHHYDLRAPEASPPARLHDDATAEALEGRLAEARDAATAGALEDASRALEAMELLLRTHPELPESAWLMAERLALGARIAALSHRDAARAADLADRAAALAGPRARAFGDPEPARTSAPAEPVRVTLAVHGPRRHEAFWDGRLATGELSATPGEHHVLVLRDGRFAWAGWVAVALAGTVDVTAPDAPPCSEEDLAGATLDATKSSARPGVTCPAWAMATASEARPGSVIVATCARDVCDAPLEWRPPAPELAMPPESPAPPPSRWPTWATWTLVGAGSLVATGAVLWGAGAFEGGHRATTTTVYDGSHLAR